MTGRTYSLAEVADIYLPDMKRGRLWLHRRIKAGQIGGYPVGRSFRMTDEHIDTWMNTLRNTTPAPGGVAVPTPAAPPVSILDGLSTRSRNRLARSA